ncbi:hypothetical protein NGRA_0283 [Nosema granulosis]|uniref:Symplekin C-terminal domain-containing protein n=1 Tax=Nosema granulosis TaxID=83296 RepID=A0A9P6H1N5_9MICR|nr:hypothetical protein NGRA_0283 [Nosema granulosis]
MEEIKNDILLNYSEKKLAILFYFYDNMEVEEVLYFWSCINQIINKDIALNVISFLMNSQENPITFPKYAQRSLNYHIHQVNKKVAKLLPRKYSQYVKQLKLFRFTKETASGLEAKQKIFDPFMFLVNSVYNILIKTSSLEITNSVENHFYSGTTLDFSMTVILLHLIKYTPKEDIPLYIKHVTNIIDNPKDVLDYINTNKPYSDILIQSIYFLNYDLYEQILLLIYDSWKYYRVDLLELLVVFDITQFKLRDDNIDILKYIIAHRPAYLKDAVEVMISSMSRNTVVSILVEYYDFLEPYFNALDLSFEEAIEASKKNTNILNIAYKKINTPEDRDRFFSTLKAADSSFILSFIKQNEDSDLISFIVTHIQLKDSLKDYILDRYLRDQKLFYKLLIYCDKPTVLPFVEEFLTDKNSMSAFLMVLKPTDILVHALNIENVKIGIRIIDISFEMSNFNENDYIYAMNTCEKDMPPLLIRVLILTFKKYQHLKSYIVSFLYKLINRGALEKDSYRIGIIRCLEMLESASIDILTSLPERTIVNILERSKTLCKICRDNIFRRENNNKREVNSLRRIIRERF